MTILLMGVLLGWPLMWATISVEGTDSFDALNRTYAYVFQRPLRYFFYVIVAALIGWLGWFVVENFAASVIWLASWAASWGAGSARMQELTSGSGESSLAHAAASLIGLLGRLGQTAGDRLFVQLFRRRLDGHLLSASPRCRRRETDEVFLDADTSEQKFGLPKLQKDAAGAAGDCGKPPRMGRPRTVKHRPMENEPGRAIRLHWHPFSC